MAKRKPAAPAPTPLRPTGSGAVGPTPDRPARGAAAERVTGGRRTYTPLGPQASTYTSSGYKSKATLLDSGAPAALHLSADGHLRYDVNDLRALAQRFDRDNGIAVAIVDRVLDVIIGPGWKLQSRCRDENAAREVERLSSEFWQAPEIRGLDDGAAFQRLLGRHLLVDGDAALIKDPASGQVQFVGADRIDNATTAKTAAGARIERGIEVDRLGRHVAYWVDDYRDEGQLRLTPRRIAAADVIFIALRRRFEQTRGTPALQPVFAMLHRINDVCDSEAAAWQLLSRMALTINRKDAAALADEIARAKDPAPTTGQTPRKIIDITDEAVIFNAEPGETIAGVDRNIPGQNFPESLKMFLRLTGLPVGLTLEWLLMIWSDTSYSSARASVKQVERATIEVVGQVRRALCAVQTWKVRQWIAEAKLPDLADIAAHEWVRQPLPMIDQQKEDEAAKVRLAAGLSAPSIEAAEGGADDAELVAIQAADVARRVQAARDLNQNYPDAEVTWRDFSAFGSESRSISSSPHGATPGSAAGAASGADTTAAEFRRQAWLGFQKDGTVSDVLANQVELRTLTALVGLPVNEQYVDPYLPVRDDVGQLVGGETIKDAAGDVIGAQPLEAGADSGAAGSAKPGDPNAAPDDAEAEDGADDELEDAAEDAGDAAETAAPAAAAAAPETLSPEPSDGEDG